MGAALRQDKIGLADNWLRHVQDVHLKHSALVDSIGDEALRVDRLSELNAIEQALNICQTTVVRDAWERGQQLTVHGWVYDLSDGLLRDLGMSAGSQAELMAAHSKALLNLAVPGAASNP